MGGYDAGKNVANFTFVSWEITRCLLQIGYYGYMWSKVFSSDMFFSRFENDTLSAETGYAYRKNILEKGSSR